MKRKILSTFIMIALLISSNQTMTVMAMVEGNFKVESFKTSEKNNIYLENMPIIESSAYDGNEGDSFVYPLGKHQWSRGNIGIDGNTYSHGIEVWVARWNYTKEKSWTYAAFDLDKQYTKLSGRALLINSYNVTDFDTTLYFYGDGQLIQSYRMTPQTMPFNITLDVFGVDNLKIYAEDNDYFQGGTSFGLTEMVLTKTDSSDKIDDDVGKQKKSIAVFTSEKSMEIKTGKSMWMGLGLLDENSGLLNNKWRKMSVVVSDPTVIALSDYTETEYGYSLEVIGKKQGASNITITDTESGISTIVTAFVQDDYANTYSYAINDITSFYPNNDFEKNIETNIYNLNGLYVNKYQCVKSTNSYNISFDVYNSKYYSGAVDIYDENGMWMGYEEIDKYSNISSIWDTGEQAYFLISDTITGKMLTYEQSSFSKHTHIDIEVPEGGYFTISNNISESPGTFFINAFEILFEGTSTAFDLFTSGGTKESALASFKKEAKKSFATRLIEARNEGLKDNVKRQSQKIMLDSMKTKIRNITKENIKTGLKDKLTSTDTMCSDLASLAEDMLAPQSFNIEWKPIFESATGIGESFFTKFAGAAGIALKGCFTLNDSASKILMTKQMAESAGTPYVTIFSSVDKRYINPYGVRVNTNGNIDAESVLQVFRVSNSDAIEVLLDSNNPLEIHELYNICFVKDDTLVQPNGKVMVQIPIPHGMKGNTCKVYRQETNSNWTILDARVQGNYLVFETDHFSLYALIGESDNLVISSLPYKTSYKEAFL